MSQSGISAWGRKAPTIVANTQYIVGAEMLLAAYEENRKQIPACLDGDRWFHSDIQAAHSFIASGAVRYAIVGRIGKFDWFLPVNVKKSSFGCSFLWRPAEGFTQFFLGLQPRFSKGFRYHIFLCLKPDAAYGVLNERGATKGCCRGRFAPACEGTARP